MWFQMGRRGENDRTLFGTPGIRFHRSVRSTAGPLMILGELAPGESNRGITASISEPFSLRFEIPASLRVLGEVLTKSDQPKAVENHEEIGDGLIEGS